MAKIEPIDNGLFLDRQVEPTVKQFLKSFHEVFHYRRDVHAIFSNYADWKAKCLFGVLGVQGEFYTGNDNVGVISDSPPYTQPTNYCGWYISTEEAEGVKVDFLCWSDPYFINEPEDVVEWLRYLILNVFEPLGYFVSGSFKCQSDSIELVVRVKYNRFEIVEV